MSKRLGGARITEWEENEAFAFDAEVLREFGIGSIKELRDDHLVLSDERLAMHLRPFGPPVAPYRFALYQLQDLHHKRVLDYCAGTGESTVIIAKKGPESVEAFDISPLAVEVARKRMTANGVSDIVRVQVMSAYSMAYRDDYFDVVFGNAALHHLDVAAAMKEILRVLRPGGKAVFREPYTGSKLLKVVRRMVPVKGRVSDNERQLTLKDIACITEGFSASKVRFMGLLSRLDRFVRHATVVKALASIDAFLLDHISLLDSYARSFVIVLTK